MTEQRFNQLIRKAFFNGAIIGVLLGIALFIFVLATGQTFGQRCEKRAAWGTQAWKACVHNLATGHSVSGKSAST